MTLIEAAWLDSFCELLPVGGHLLDLGCGSGLPIACELVRRGYAVAGVDSAPEMTAMFARNLPGQPTEIADMRVLALQRRFAGIIAWDSLFNLSRAAQRGMFAIFQKHAAARAALMFTGGQSNGSAVGEMGGEPLFHASLDQAEYHDLLDVNGFEVVRHVVEDENCGRRTVWVAQSRSESLDAGVQEFTR